MSDLVITYYPITQKKLRFLTAGTAPFRINGYLPNLPGYIQRNGIHPLRHYQVTRCVKTFSWGAARCSVYEVKRYAHQVHILMEYITGDEITYIEGAFRPDDYDRWLSDLMAGYISDSRALGVE